MKDVLEKNASFKKVPFFYKFPLEAMLTVNSQLFYVYQRKILTVSRALQYKEINNVRFETCLLTCFVINYLAVP
jgi:hypothetical protein